MNATELIRVSGKSQHFVLKALSCGSVPGAVRMMSESGHITTNGKITNGTRPYWEIDDTPALRRWIEEINVRPSPSDDVLTSIQISRQTNIAHRSVRKLMSTGVIPGSRLAENGGGRWGKTPLWVADKSSELNEWIKLHKIAPLPTTKPDGFSPEKLSSELGITKQHINNMCRKGLLPAVKYGKEWVVIDSLELKRWADGVKGHIDGYLSVEEIAKLAGIDRNTVIRNFPGVFPHISVHHKHFFEDSQRLRGKIAEYKLNKAEELCLCGCLRVIDKSHVKGLKMYFDVSCKKRHKKAEDRRHKLIRFQNALSGLSDNNNLVLDSEEIRRATGLALSPRDAPGAHKVGRRWFYHNSKELWEWIERAKKRSQKYRSRQGAKNKMVEILSKKQLPDGFTVADLAAAVRCCNAFASRVLHEFMASGSISRGEVIACKHTRYFFTT